MQLRKSALSLSIVAALALCGTAAAQDAQPSTAKDDAKTLDTVVVSGIRGATEKSLDTKRDANTRVEVVTAEDVGKLPAHNVADTLQRLPGVNISSSSADEGGFDEADRVSLRGTSPSLTQTLINGHTVGSADWFVLSQSANVGRSVSYSLLPSELVSSVQVFKSSEAKLQDGGTTGSVNVITRKPLEFAKELTFEGSIGAVRSEQAGSNDPQLSALFNYRNADSTFGVMVQAFKQKRELRREAQEFPGGWFKITGRDNNGDLNDVGLNNPDLIGVWAPSLIGSTLFEQTRDRTGGLVEVQFKPSDNLTLGVSGFSSDMKANNYNRNFMLWGGNFANSQSPNAGYVVKDGVLTNVNYAGVDGTAYGIYDMIARDASAKSQYVTFDADWQISDDMRLKFQAGSTKGVGETERQYIAEVAVGEGGGAGWSSHGTDAPTDWNIGGDISPTGAYGFGTWGNQQVRAIDKEKWVSADFSLYFDGTLTSLDYGVRYAKHDRQAQSPIGAANNGDAMWAALQNGPVGHFPDGFASGIGGNFPRDIWYYTRDALKDAIVKNSVLATDGSRRNYGAEWSVKEKNTAAYVQANFSGDKWSGNVGLRYVAINQDILSYRAVPAGGEYDVTSLFAWPYAGWVRVPNSNSHKRLLPSANFKIDLADDVVLRFAASQTQTLPDYSALGAAASGSDLDRTGSAGNPKLKPVVSTNFDANLEWYFMPRGLLSLGAFSMNMKDYVAYGTEKQMLPSELTNQIEEFTIALPINANAQVQGFEVAYEQPIGENFGINANYTYSDGSTSHTWADGSHSLLGNSKNTWNVGAYFENDRFGARLSYTHRDAFLIGLSAVNPYYQDDFGTLSASLSYKATDWLSFSFDALNLNNPTYKYYQTKSIPVAFYENGRQYYFNVRFKF